LPLAALLTLLPQKTSGAQERGKVESRGRLLLTDSCARCHAVGRAGSSAHREAPAFRTLGQRYPIDSLAEALAEGLMTGHKDMPEFIFEIEDVDAILAYLHSVQGAGDHSTSKAGAQMKQTSMILALLTGFCVLQNTAALAADAYHGEQIARRWCTSCHVVADNQRRVTGEAPPFAEIANRPGFDAARLALFLLDPHPKMPNMSLTRIEAADLAAYIGSLAK
jgi:mono/diheme cytochrome c family protein